MIVLVAVLVLVVGGGVTALILLTRPSEAAGPGRYHPLVKNPSSCSALSDATFGFNIVTYPPKDGTIAQECFGMARTADNTPVVDVFREIFPDPGGVSAAENREARGDGTPLSGTGFENDPFVGYLSYVDPSDDEKIDHCTVEYRRSNEWVKLDFSLLPNVSDLASCQKLVVPYARPFYTLIG
ncbi:MAG TPA: hypothetical protein VJ914_40170 [Pseudonocardiaceae bacterium]|nr:hypothetical protein [Pseudonocardiaceae bacterium]